jgi:ketosteroid isomerase-like protein
VTDSEPASAAVVAERYRQLFNAGEYVEMGRLFAPDAVWRPTFLPDVHGADAIIAGYADTESQMDKPLQITEARYVGDGLATAAVFTITSDDGTFKSEVVDLFEIDDHGRIQSMTVYARG